MFFSLFMLCMNFWGNCRNTPPSLQKYDGPSHPPIKQTLLYRFLLFKLVKFIDFNVQKIKPSYVKVSTKIN